MWRSPASDSRSGIGAAIVANVTLGGLLLAMWILEARWPAVYYRVIPEDAPIEWATFWAEFLAAAANALLAWRTRRGGIAAWWYCAGLALFCFGVAGEEISWGQRLLGFQSPSYMLAHNVQLETNIHNLFRPEVWSSGIYLLIAGFGLLAPLLLLLPGPARLARRFSIYVPPASWTPGYAAVLAAYVFRPYHLCEEVVELAIGIGFVLAAVNELGARSEDSSSWGAPASRMAGTAALMLALGIATTWATQNPPVDEAPRIASAKAELEALREDLVAMRQQRSGRFVTNCNLQARLHSLDREQVLLPLLADGAFARLVATEDPKRAKYLLDPWNMPYWISDQCDSAARYIMLFSFGPNRRRESTEWEAGGDDLSTYAFHLGTPRPGDWHALAREERAGRAGHVEKQEPAADGETPGH